LANGIPDDGPGSPGIGAESTDTPLGARHWSGRSHAALRWARHSQKSSKRPLRHL